MLLNGYDTPFQSGSLESNGRIALLSINSLLLKTGISFLFNTGILLSTALAIVRTAAKIGIFMISQIAYLLFIKFTKSKSSIKLLNHPYLLYAVNNDISRC